MLRLNYLWLIALALSAQVSAMPCGNNKEPVPDPNAIFDRPSPSNPGSAIHHPGENQATIEGHNQTHLDTANPMKPETQGPSPWKTPAEYWEQVHINTGAMFDKPLDPQLAIHYPGKNIEKPIQNEEPIPDPNAIFDRPSSSDPCSDIPHPGENHTTIDEEPVPDPNAIFDRPASSDPCSDIPHPGENQTTIEGHNQTHPDTSNPMKPETQGPSPWKTPAEYWEHVHINTGAMFDKPLDPQLAIHYPGKNNDKGEIIWERSMDHQDPGVETTIPPYDSGDEDTVYINGDAMYDEPLHPEDKELLEHPSSIGGGNDPEIKANEEDLLMNHVDSANQGISKRGRNEFLYFYTHLKCWKTFQAPYKSVHAVGYYLQSKGKRWCCSGAKGECVVHARYQGTYAYWCSANEVPRCITCDKMGELLFRISNQCYDEGTVAGKAVLGGIGELTVIKV
ncbi:hypothetical protein BZA77DRAFT_388502 [Pyronema omphalodes]|nr:hypothetical protein BZA77DRAFT_388502 [Pyronema omphalodes]